MARAVAVAILHKIGRNCIKPCGEILAGIKFRPVLINANESFLSEVAGILLVLQAADKVVKQLPGVARHQFIQGRIVPGDKPRHVRPVRVVSRGGRHGMPGAEGDCALPGIILLGFKVSF